MALTNQELEKIKEESERRATREDVKSHCTKISKGIRANGSTSANRAIWELFQNAGDLSESAEIKITLSENEFVFAHKGKPFTDDTLRSLVKQVSSQEKEGDDTVGQYGTGFLTTHTFGRKIKVNGSMIIDGDKGVFVDVNDFMINRENFEDINQFIDDMTEQIFNVKKLFDEPQKDTPREWTTLAYALNQESLNKAQHAIDEAIRLMPYVLTFNDNIGSCEIVDQTRFFQIEFRKEDKTCSTEKLQCKRVIVIEDQQPKDPVDCYYLELHEGKSRIILPLKSECEVQAFCQEVPRLFVHFPLISPSTQSFDVQFLFHSHLFTPNEPRENIIIPSVNDANDRTANKNIQILDEMTELLFEFLNQNVEHWNYTIELAPLKIRTTDIDDQKTQKYYENLKQKWVKTFSHLKMIEIDQSKHSISDEPHPYVFEPNLVSFLKEHYEQGYLNIIYEYAKKTQSLIPNTLEILAWSEIIEEWSMEDRENNYLPLKEIVNYVSSNKGEHLHVFLTMLVSADQTQFFDDYALLPNREGKLRKRTELKDAKSISDPLYKLLHDFNPDMCTQWVDPRYADVIQLVTYSMKDLKKELNDYVKEMEESCWTRHGEAYYGNFEKSLIALCSVFHSENGSAKRNMLMPLICGFEGVDYSEITISECRDENGLDLFRQVFLSLVENQMMKIKERTPEWVKDHLVELQEFVKTAQGSEYDFCEQYAIYPDMLYSLHKPEELKRNNNVHEKLFELYERIMDENLKSLCVHEKFQNINIRFCSADNRYTSSSIAKLIENKLTDDDYQNPNVIDIIELTEEPGEAGEDWRTWFKNIYEQRERIRYNLGSPEERKAINRMMKQRDPQLLSDLAAIAEAGNARQILAKAKYLINQQEDEEYKRMLGEYVESNLQRFITNDMEQIGVTVENNQSGQDLVLSKPGHNDYFIEIKSRWASNESVTMSMIQFNKAVNKSDRYALVYMNMCNYDQSLAKRNEPFGFDEIRERVSVRPDIGSIEHELHNRYQQLKEITDFDDSSVRISAEFEGVRVPQRIFREDRKTYEDLIDFLHNYFA